VAQASPFGWSRLCAAASRCAGSDVGASRVGSICVSACVLGLGGVWLLQLDRFLFPYWHGPALLPLVSLSLESVALRPSPFPSQAPTLGPALRRRRCCVRTVATRALCTAVQGRRRRPSFGSIFCCARWLFSGSRMASLASGPMPSRILRYLVGILRRFGNSSLFHISCLFRRVFTFTTSTCRRGCWLVQRSE
jgi:hypothetical protein